MWDWALGLAKLVALGLDLYSCHLSTRGRFTCNLQPDFVISPFFVIIYPLSLSLSVVENRIIKSWKR